MSSSRTHAIMEANIAQSQAELECFACNYGQAAEYYGQATMLAELGGDAELASILRARRNEMIEQWLLNIKNVTLHHTS